MNPLWDTILGPSKPWEASTALNKRIKQKEPPTQSKDPQKQSELTSTPKPKKQSVSIHWTACIYTCSLYTWPQLVLLSVVSHPVWSSGHKSSRTLQNLLCKIHWKVSLLYVLPSYCEPTGLQVQKTKRILHVPVFKQRERQWEACAHSVCHCVASTKSIPEQWQPFRISMQQKSETAKYSSFIAVKRKFSAIDTKSVKHLIFSHAFHQRWWATSGNNACSVAKQTRRSAKLPWLLESCHFHFFVFS